MATLVSSSLLLLLLLLVIVSSCKQHAADEVVSSSGIDGGELADADDPVCDIVFDLCLGSCWRSGHCMNCCKYHGYVHGRCSLKHGDACYCCHTPDQKREQQQQQAGAEPPIWQTVAAATPANHHLMHAS